MSESVSNLTRTNGRSIPMLTWLLLQALLVPLVLFGVMTVYKLDTAAAELRPIITQMQKEHVVMMDDVERLSQEIKSIQMDIIRWDLRMDKHTHDAKGGVK